MAPDKTFEIEAYPLAWPVGYPRTERPQRSRFSGTPGLIKKQLLQELETLGGRDVIISTNVALRRDGLPYANQKKPDDTGVAVYFLLNGEQMVLACDKWIGIADNMRAIAKTIEAMRGMERWGVSQMLQRAFTGFKALPSSVTLPWEELLGVGRHASTNDIKAAYRQKSKETHPDLGGSDAKFRQVQEAYEMAMRDLNNNYHRGEVSAV